MAVFTISREVLKSGSVDISQPGVQEFYLSQIRNLRAAGFKFFKTDFLRNGYRSPRDYAYSKWPAEKTIEMYEKAMSLAPDAGEKRRVLSGLANAKSRAALEMATAYLKDEALSREAEYAVVKIAEGIHADLPDLAKETLKKIIARTKNNTLREQAQEILEKMEQL